MVETAPITPIFSTFSHGHYKAGLCLTDRFALPYKQGGVKEIAQRLSLGSYNAASVNLRVRMKRNENSKRTLKKRK
jgi:hypothetical protein